jgi:hypothetical protein
MTSLEGNHTRTTKDDKVLRAKLTNEQGGITLYVLLYINPDVSSILLYTKGIRDEHAGGNKILVPRSEI